MHLRKIPFKKLIFLFLVILYSVELAQAGEHVTLSPDGGHSNQIQINAALKNGNVYLNAGIYEIDNTIIINSNRILSGDPNAIIRVYSGSSHWFVGAIGVISCTESVQNVEICGFQMDGNIGNLPSSYADSRSDTDHDCEKLIILRGYSNQFANNIKVHDMKLYNSFSDGCYIIFGENVQFYDNFISNCQHEGFYFSCVNYGSVYGNKIAGICSDCGRLDNCQNCKVYNNYFFSYNGESYGQFKGGQAGLQIANSGSSHGYNAANKPQFTNNIEVCFNVFADPGRQAIWLHNYDGNVFVHDNEFKDAEGLETLGIPVGDISVYNPPTVEMSENVFSSIFNILDVDFAESAKTNQTADSINYTVQQTPKGKIAGGIKIIGFKDIAVIDNQQYIESNESILIKSSVIRNPSLNSWSGGIQKSKKDIKTTIINGTAYANMTVKTSWYSLKTSSISGKTVKSNIKTSVYTFSDVFSPAPEVIEQPENITGIIYVYPTSFQIRVPSKNLVKIDYEYNGTTTEHLLLTGIRNQTDTGVIYTEYSRINRWTGELEHQGDWVNVLDIFDKTKLNVTVETPYKEVKVDNFEIKVSKFPQRAIASWFYPFIAALLILLLYIKWLHSDLKKY
jgi:hypothetical protein